MKCPRIVFEIGRVFLFTCASLVVFLGAGSCYFGSRNAFFDYLNGYHILVHTREFSCKPHSGDRIASIRVEMINATSRPIEILGTILSCDCMMVDSLPRTIAKNSLIGLNVEVHQEEGSAPRQLLAEFLTNDPVQPRVLIRINTGE